MGQVLHKNVWILTATQALMVSSATISVFIGAIIGAELSPNKELATLPVACFVIGTALASIPSVLAMKKFGRKKIFFFISIFSGSIALLTSFAIYISSFSLFVVSQLLMGSTMAGVQQFRFAAMESVPEPLAGRAASQVLFGGIIAAVIGPEVAVFGKNLLDHAFSGSFIILSIMLFCVSLLISQYQNIIPTQTENTLSQRPLMVIIKQPVLWVAILSAMVGYVVMSFIMTATPISMHVIDHHSLEDTKWVIQSHILAMFLPSLTTSWIIKNFGIVKMIIAGIICFGICIILGYSGHEFRHYWSSLVFLGVGWNFLFIGGTMLLPSSYHESERYKVQALNEFSVFSSQAIAALTAGWLVYLLGWENMLLLTITLIIILITALLYWLKTKEA